MNTSNKQEFWENLMSKYADRNKELEEREEHLRARIEAMQALIDSGQAGNDKSPCDPPGGFFSCLKKAWFSGPKSNDCTCKSETTKARTVSESPVKAESPQKEVNAMPFPTSAYLKKGSSAGDTNKQPSKITTNAPDYAKSPECPCNPCEGEQALKAMQESENGYKKNPSCVCNPCEGEQALKAMQESENIKKKNSNCACNPCQLDELLMQPDMNNRLMADNTSLNSMDMFYMQNVKEMAQNYKNLNQQVKTFEQKEKAFQDVLKEYASMNTDNLCLCNSKQRKDENEKKCADLQLENFLLRNELKEMRLEIRQYMERMEGPMLFKIESEKYKNRQLELKLDEAAMEMIRQGELHEKEMNQLKMELCSSNLKNYNLDEQCGELKKQIDDLTEQLGKISEDLVRQKISDAETIKRLQVELEKLRKQINTPQKECDLYQIARELSGDLKACEPCNECANVPSDIKTTVMYIKELTDAVNEHFPESDPNETSELKTPYAESEGEERGGDEVLTETQMDPPLASSTPRELTLSEAAATTTQQEVDPCTCLDPPPKKKQPPCICIQRSTKAQIPCAERDPCLFPNKICPCPLPPKIGCGGPLPPPPQSKLECKCIEPKPISPPPADDCGCSTPSPPPPPPPAADDCGCSPPEEVVPKELDDCGCSPPKKQISCLTSSSPSFPKTVLEELCKCLMVETESEATMEPPPEVSNSECLKIAHNVTASQSRDILKSITSVKAMKISKNFPLSVDTTVDVIDKPPDGVHVTTTVTQSGTLLVVTEGPEGIIETNLVYTEQGDVEVVTEILDYKAAGIGKKKHVPAITDGKVDDNTLNASKCVESEAKKKIAIKEPATDSCACDPNCPTKDATLPTDSVAEDTNTTAADANTTAKDADATAKDADATAEAPQKADEGGQGGEGTEVAIPDTDKDKDKVETSLSFHLQVDDEQNMVEIENKVSLETATAEPAE